MGNRGPAPAAGGGGGAGRRSRRETHEEARARRAAIDDPETVMAAAARLLESRSRTEHEVRSRLAHAGYRPELVDETIARLLALGYLDDEEFARSWVASRDRAHPRGERALRVELQRKGVGRETIDLVLAERAAAAEEGAGRGDGGGDLGPAPGETPASADEAAAGRLLERRRSALDRVADPRQRRQRAYALLARSGFDPGICGEVSAKFIAGQVED